eukprot:GHRR01017207.1.p1 GENE.GHRR01017207.1~~GHRR01017207.1.p1  ORF type:complete len:122 (+),score=19.50 GHRR01017207.1:759-1124(+)
MVANTLYNLFCAFVTACLLADVACCPIPVLASSGAMVASRSGLKKNTREYLALPNERSTRWLAATNLSLLSTCKKQTPQATTDDYITSPSECTNHWPILLVLRHSSTQNLSVPTHTCNRPC